MFTLTAKDYTEYIKLAYELIHSKGDYITELDSVTGDGDHWTNINMGFENLVKNVDRLETMELYDAELCTVLKAMLDAIVARGQAKEGYKTMIDSLAPAVKKYEECLANGTPSAELCELVKKAAEDGAENTKNMEAIRGRASYQANRGLGHLDPGAVTMSYQIATLMDYAAGKITE